jgi:alpha-mannosidase
VERMKQLMGQRETEKDDKNKPAKVMFSTPTRFLESVLREPHDFPVVRTELEATLRGAYTTEGEIKKGNRQSENLLLTAEKFSAIASWMGVQTYPQSMLFDAWKKVMLNQFHDTISGTDVPPSIDDALQRYAEVQSTVGGELQATLHAIVGRINTKGPGIPLTVFNPLAWERTDVAEGILEWRNTELDVVIVDDEGRSVNAQILSREMQDKKPVVRFAFLAESIPSLGYRTYWAHPGNAPGKTDAASPASTNELENEFFKVSIDPATGCLSSIYDKAAQREVIAPGAQGNLIQIIEDLGDSEGFLKDEQGKSEHNIWDGPSWNVDADPQISPIERGPMGVTVVVKKKFGLARFTQRITLTHKIPRIDFDLAIDWQGKNRMVKVAFPLSVSSPTSSSEIPYGVIARESDGKECAAQNWVDISDGGYGVSLLNDSRYGHDFTPNTIRISVLRSPDHPVAATDETGTHRIRYALYPHRGSWQEARSVQRGSEWNAPLIVSVSEAHAGDLASKHSFVQVEPENVVLSVLKKAEDSDDLLLRCYESSGRACSAKITFSDYLKMDAVHATDLLENSQSDLAADNNGFSAPVGGWSIESFKLIRD